MNSYEFVVTIPSRGWVLYLIASSLMASVAASFLLFMFPPWPCEELTFWVALGRAKVLATAMILFASWLIAGAVATVIGARQCSFVHLFSWFPFGASFVCMPIMFFGLQSDVLWQPFWHCLQPEIHSRSLFSLHMMAGQLLTFGFLMGVAVFVQGDLYKSLATRARKTISR